MVEEKLRKTRAGYTDLFFCFYGSQNKKLNYLQLISLDGDEEKCFFFFFRYVEDWHTFMTHAFEEGVEGLSKGFPKTE